MKTQAMLSALILLFCGFYSEVNWARGHFGFYFGAPVYSYPYYPYYYPPVVVTLPPAPPQVYIQQSSPITQTHPSGYWYYCNNPEGYYPSSGNARMVGRPLSRHFQPYDKES